MGTPTTATTAAPAEVNPKIVRWFEGRGISHETLIRMGVLSGRRASIGGKPEIVPDIDGDVIIFPYGDGAKYRAAHKKFWQKPPSVKTFWNDAILDDPSLLSGEHALIIQEGELDSLSSIEAGYPFSVSVPDGAPPPTADPGDYDLKFSYILNNWEKLKLIKRVIIAVDNDPPGKRLSEELVRRLGRVRCSWVEYPDGCKDMNDVLMKHGKQAVLDTISAAKPFPVNGLYTWDEIPAEPDFEPFSTGWGRLDNYLLPYFPCLMVVTAFAGSGKTSWVTQMVAQMAIMHGFQSAIASFEMRLKPFLSDILRAVKLDKPKRLWSQADYDSTDAWIRDKFVFIAPDPRDDDEREYNIEWLIETASAAVIRHGIRVLVIDPWNEIEHCRRRDESVVDYTGRAIRMLKRFGRQFNVLVILVAHPTKAAANKEPSELSLYDVADSAHFSNKADLGVIIERQIGEQNFVSNVHVRKVRYQPETGKPGTISLTYDPETRTFSQ